MATLQHSLAVVSSSSSSGIAGKSCQFSSRSSRRQVDGRRGWKTIRGQAEEREGGGGGGGEDEDFDARLARLARKVTSGTGKKAELRKARKEGGGDGSVAPSKPKESLFIDPVLLQEPASDGLTVKLGVTPYTERLHGRLAALGLAAVLLVELATGDSFVKFHDSGTLTVQVYAILGLATLFVKFEKERISVWPK